MCASTHQTYRQQHHQTFVIFDTAIKIVVIQQFKKLKIKILITFIHLYSKIDYILPSIVITMIEHIYGIIMIFCAKFIQYYFN